LLEVLRPYRVLEMVRTGRVEMARGNTQTTPAGSKAPTPAVVAARDVGSHSV
jgi:hypothetical protein